MSSVYVVIYKNLGIKYSIGVNKIIIKNIYTITILIRYFLYNNLNILIYLINFM